MDSLNDMTLAQLDPEIQAVLDSELGRQRETLEMIASENFVPRAVLEAQGSVLTNKYAEGYPGRRYYGGCEFVDVAESLAIERAKQVFGGDYVNVQPHAGAQANAAALMAMANVGDPILGLSLAHGGHLTHGMRLNFSGKHYKAVAYEVDRETMRIEPEKVREAALAERPRVIIAGWSAYPRHLDFQAFRDIADEVGAALWVDMAHFAGLVAAGLHPNPVPFADVVTTTVHKTLGGPRSGMILSSRGEQWGKKLNTAVFPGQQGGPLMHVIAAKAIAMKVAQTEEFKDRQRRTLEGAQILAERLGADDAKNAGIKLVTGGTDVHLVLVDLVESELNGQQAEDLLHEVGITVNRNAVPFADVVTTTVHKTLGGPRSGMILSSRGEQWGKKLNTAVFPGQQGGPLMHVIAAKAIAMKVAQTEEFKDRQRRTLEGAQILAERLGADDAKNAGIKLVTGGTDVHLVLVDLVESELNGKQAEDLLHEVGITVNRNAVPFDPRPPAVTSGLRIGTPALATRGFDAEDFAEVADIIGTTLAQGASGSNVEVDALRARVKKLTDKHPLYAGLEQ